MMMTMIIGSVVKIHLYVKCNMRINLQTVKHSKNQGATKTISVHLLGTMNTDDISC